MSLSKVGGLLLVGRLSRIEALLPQIELDLGNADIVAIEANDDFLKTLALERKIAGRRYEYLDLPHFFRVPAEEKEAAPK